jgi:N-methylhydantoinase A
MRVVGVDIGGTFTDFMLYDTESAAVHVHKVRSTPDDPGRAMISGLVELCGNADITPADVGAVFHATTVATNAVLEHRGAEAGMVTTRGFRDVAAIPARKATNPRGCLGHRGSARSSRRRAW